MKAQITGSSGYVSKALSKGAQQEPKVSETRSVEAAPRDSFAVATPIHEPAGRPEPGNPTPADVKETAVTTEKPPVSTSPKQTTSAGTSNYLGTITQLDEPAPQLGAVEEGPTLADLAKSATQSIGRGLANLVFGDPLAPFKAELDSINALDKQAQQLKTPEQFAAKTAEFKKRLAAGETLENMRPEVYSVAREAARQETEMRAYDCQVLGALAMDDGHIAEMRTGEGKTLTAVLPLYLNALAGKGAHLVTVNETLAKRDAEWMGPIFKKLGMSVGCVAEDQSPEEKRAGYNCDVTYVSDRALGFDFLRDRGATNPSERVQRGHFFALIDEVDEVLIDEARTPMILSGKSGEPSKDYQVFGQIAKTLIPGDDFKLDEEKRTVWLTDGGLRYVENEVTILEAQDTLKSAEPGSLEATKAKSTLQNGQLLRSAIRRENAAQKAFDDLDYDKPNPIARAIGMNGEYDKVAASKAEAKLTVATKVREQLASKVDGINLYSKENYHRVHYMDAALKAQTQFRKGKDYNVEGGEVKIVDQNKGRVSDGKRYSQGLHQALEAKEGLEIKSETRTISKITMPELIAQYERKSGMTGTGKTSEGEFLEFYGLDVVEIPTNKPVIRTDHPDVVFATKEAKYQSVVEEAIQSAQDGRPVLVGTISVNANKEVAARILQAGWPADRVQILNAERVKGGEDFHDANSGRSGTITLTTGDRAKDVRHDPVNYKKMSFLAREALSAGKPVLVDVDNKHDAEQIGAWLGDVPVGFVITPEAQQGGVQIRVRGPESANESTTPDSGFAHIDAKDHVNGKPAVLQMTEANQAEVVAKALAAFSEGEPVIVASATSKQMALAAENFLDRGLGLDALPMVCDGKEKENVMIEMAGRSGMITIATNMAGRGANIKPDLVATDHIAEAAFQQASEGKPVTITVDKKSQAVKIERLMADYIPVALSDKPEQEAKSGQVLVRYGKDLPAVENGVSLSGADFNTKGLYVIGTERAASRRVDNQLIGRSGRQGAEGDSKFLISLEDDVPRIFGGEKFEPLLSMFGNSQDGVSSDIVNSLMEKAQDRVENQHFEQRDNAAKYDKVHRVQRENFYKFREKVLTGEEDPKELVADFGAQAIAKVVKEKLGNKRKYTADDVSKAVAQVSAEFKVPLSFQGDGKVKSDEIDGAIYEQLETLLDNPNLSEDKLKAVTLNQMDGAWQEHLEVMDALQTGIHLESMTGRKPEEVFAERGFELYKGTIEVLKDNFARNILPAAAKLPKDPPGAAVS